MEKTYNNFIFVNTYNRNGKITDSTPYDSREDAIAECERVADLITRFWGEKFTRTEDSWTNGRFTLKIEKEGDINLYLHNAWQAYGANYISELINPNKNFIRLLKVRISLGGAKSVADMERILADFSKKYFTDIDVRTIFDKRAEMLSKATTAEQVLDAIIGNLPKTPNRSVRRNIFAPLPK